MQAVTSSDALWDKLIGWQGAAPKTRSRLLQACCSGIRLRSLLSNSTTALIVGGFIIADTRAPAHLAWLIAALLGGLLPRAYAAHLRREGRFDERPERKALTLLAISGVYGLIWGAGPFILLPDIGGIDVGILLIIVVFGTIMGPYAAMPGILYVRLLTTGLPTLLAVALYTSRELTVVCGVLGVWLVLRTDIWRGYHRALRQQIELGEALESRRAELEHAQRTNEEANAALRTMAETDPLTGAANRRHFLRALETLRAPGALLVFDLDRFKQVNDSFGHQAGDVLLCEVARVVQQTLRDGDLLARLGGDEFAVILPGVDPACAQRVAERVRAAVSGRVVSTGEHALRSSISIGLAAVSAGGPLEPDALLREADAALYAAKRQGRDRICTAAAAPQTTAS